MNTFALTPMQRTVFALFLSDPPRNASDLESMTEYAREAVSHAGKLATPDAVPNLEDMELIESVLGMLETSAELMRINTAAAATVRQSSHNQL